MKNIHRSKQISCSLFMCCLFANIKYQIKSTCDERADYVYSDIHWFHLDILEQGFPIVLDHVLLQNFNIWACSHKSIKIFNNKHTLTFGNNIHWYMYNYLEITTITGFSFAASCLRNLLPGSAPIFLRWFKLVPII